MKTLRISALQLEAHDRGGYAARRDSLIARIDAAAAACDLLVLPEATFPAYVLGDAGIDDGEIANALDALKALARAHSCTIVAGAAVRRNGKLYNSAVVFDSDGSVAGTADKAVLWHFDRKWFAPGEDIVPIRTSAGTLGVLVCADGRMPAIARALVDRGAELLVMPTAWVTSGRDPQHLENIQADLLARVRAFENGVPFVAANKCGVERSMVAYCGKSQIVAADGSVIAIASERGEQIVSAQIELRAPAPHRSSIEIAGASAPLAQRAARIAVSCDALPADIGERLDVLDAEVAVAPGDAASVAALNAIAPAAAFEARDVYDPGTLLAARRAGTRIAVVNSPSGDEWLERIARARALELRMYVLVFDGGAQRAYAVDPDGAVVAGTFGDYRLASFTLDPRRTSETFVAPGTDVAAGIERVNALLAEIPTR